MTTYCEVVEADCRKALKDMADNGVKFDSVVTDAPYHLEAMVKRFGKTDSKAAKHSADGRFTRQSGGWIGKSWDADDDGSRIAFDPEFWESVCAVLRPGAFVLAFGSPRHGHRQACAMEDAGLVMHPTINWAYGSGFPKGKCARKAVEKAGGDATRFDGWYFGVQARKVACEPIYVGQVPLLKGPTVNTLLEEGTGAVNIEGCRGPGDRWPSTLVHDNSEGVRDLLPGESPEYFESYPFEGEPLIYHKKADRADRHGSTHPTVKPVGLMRALVRHVTPPGGHVLDPFAGSGTTGEAAMLERRAVTLIERDEGYVISIERRLGTSAIL